LLEVIRAEAEDQVVVRAASAETGMAASDTAEVPRASRPSLIPSDASIEATLKSVKLLEHIFEGRCHLGCRCAVQPLCLD
jgi:hypothetical protein